MSRRGSPQSHGIDNLDQFEDDGDYHDDSHFEDSANVNRKLSVYKHIKKKAANDAQLLMYAILLFFIDLILMTKHTLVYVIPAIIPNFFISELYPNSLFPFL